MDGADHKTGSKIDLSNAYNILKDEVRKYYPNCKVLYKWNTEDCITLDKIPYIGEFSHFMPNMYIGTGFNKWGMTSSNVAANIIVDKILGHENEYEDVFKATRLHPIKNNAELRNMIKETANSLVINKFKVPEVGSDEVDLEGVEFSSGEDSFNDSNSGKASSGEVDSDDAGGSKNDLNKADTEVVNDVNFVGINEIDNNTESNGSAVNRKEDNNVAHIDDGDFSKIENIPNHVPEKIFSDLKNDTRHVLEYKGQKIGIYKDANGKIYTVKPICTHLGCLLSWNNLDKTWDCPCHGSKFDYMGHQLYNPAIRDLDVVEVEKNN